MTNQNENKETGWHDPRAALWIDPHILGDKFDDIILENIPGPKGEPIADEKLDYVLNTVYEQLSPFVNHAIPALFASMTDAVKDATARAAQDYDGQTGHNPSPEG